MKTIRSHVCLAVIAVAAVSATAFAEPEIKGPPSELAAYLSTLPGTVQIVGEGEIKIPADRAIVSLRIDSENKSLAEAIKLSHGVRARLTAFLKEQGIGADRLQPAPFSSTQKQAIFSDKVKSHKVSTLVKVATHNEQEFQAVTKSVDQFTEVTYVRAEFEHSDKDALKTKASGKACEDAERQKRTYEEKLDVKLVPKSIRDIQQMPLPQLRGQYGAWVTGEAESSYSARALTKLPMMPQVEAVEEETPFGELVFNARVAVEYSVERK